MSLVGLRNFRVVKLTQDDKLGVAYGPEIKELKGAKNVKITPKSDTAENYGDDQLIETVTSLGAIEVEMEIADLTLEEQAYILGYDYAEGVLKETKDFNPPELALGFEGTKSDNGFRNIWLVKGKAEPMEEEFKTKEDKTDFQGKTLKLKFMPRINDGVIKYKADSNGTNAIEASKFFTTEFLKTGKKGA